MSNNNNGKYYNTTVERTGVTLTIVALIVCFFIMLYGLAVNNAYIGFTGLFLEFAVFMLIPLTYKLA
ncbi:MAG: hypothetical protein VZQ62_07420, partial [Methanosphaera sp.]|nr:hypothetical protein [Methanosphaera sp.]